MAIRIRARMKSMVAIKRRPLAPIQVQGGEIVCTAGDGGDCAMSARRILGGQIPPKGWAVRPLKRYASWVQNVVRQFGLYPVCAKVS